MYPTNSSLGHVNTHVASNEFSFDAATVQLRSARFRRELLVREIASPERIAPNSIALSAGVELGSQHSGAPSGDSPYGAGRLILLHDPASRDEWGGSFRFVCYAQAPLEVEIGVEPFIADVTWSWLLEALDTRSASYTYASGTATKTISTGFGALEAQADSAQLELRASWTPLDEHFARHAEAWGELICLLAGLPHDEGVASLQTHRAHRGGE